MTRAFGPGGPIHGEAIVLAPSASRTANGNGTGKRAAAHTQARLTLDVTARSGTTPTLDVAVQTSGDGTTWSTVASFAQKTNVGAERKVFSGLDEFVRVTWTLAGTTPNFTFKVSGYLV